MIRLQIPLMNKPVYPGIDLHSIRLDSVGVREFPKLGYSGFSCERVGHDCKFGKWKHVGFRPMPLFSGKVSER